MYPSKCVHFEFGTKITNNYELVEIQRDDTEMYSHTTDTDTIMKICAINDKLAFNKKTNLIVKTLSNKYYKPEELFLPTKNSLMVQPNISNDLVKAAIYSNEIYIKDH